MKPWWKPDREIRCAALTRDAGGLLGVSLRLSTQPASTRHRVLGHVRLDDTTLDAASVARLARQLDAKTARWVMQLDRSSYQTLSLPAPPVPEAELDQALRWTLADQLLWPPAEANLAWLRVPQPEQMPGKVAQIHVFASHSQTIDSLSQAFSQAGLDLDAVDVHETAQRNIAQLIGDISEPVALLRISGKHLEFTLSHDGDLHYQRWVPIASPEQADDLQVIEPLLVQIQRSLDHVKRHLHYLPIRRLWLASVWPLADLGDRLRGMLALPVEMLDLSAHLDFTATPDLHNLAAQASLLPLLGSCLRFSKPGPH